MSDQINGEQLGRDKNGRFVKGHKSTGGRAPVAREVRYYEIMQSACTFADWDDICKKAVVDAKRGDSVARKWLADYLIGPPVERKDITSGGEKIKGYVVVSPDDWTDSAE
jgi:hypothetical protein